MHFESSTPRADGFFMPAEFSAHRGCILIWPERPGSWRHGAKAAREAFGALIRAICPQEHVYLAVNARSRESAVQMLAGTENLTIFDLDSDDAWARDIAPTFVTDRHGAVRGVNWRFNAWGGEIDGLYASWARDDAFAPAFLEAFGYRGYNAAPFVLEGGSVHSDGEGTLLVTEACLLSAGRNPQLSREEIAQTLCDYLGAQTVLWLPRGIYNDETNEHVDNVCAFIRPAEVVLAWTDNPNDPQYALSAACLSYLESVRDAKGRRLTVHKLPIPDVPVCVSEEELRGYDFADGEDTREIGERLAASYVNFYFANGAILLPAFGGENAAADARAAQIMRKLCPDRAVISIYARDILTGGGNIHCITQQIP
ncbi:MAG: agmatine deiminase [Oscillospiraceae bacterium]|jgi:agmatine deiminase|nr:agmatine deiminase [Oscillospiraceae bacterium]